MYIIIIYSMFIELDLRKIDGFDWDDGNTKKNEIKHKVHYKESEQIFFDRPLYLKDNEHSKTESRFYVFGETNNKRLLIIVFTIRGKKIRVISARNQDNKEKRFYLVNIKSYLKEIL